MKHKRIAKIISLFVLMTIIMMGVCGCMQQQKLSIDDCLKYMKTKYGEDFTYLEPYDDFQPTARTLKIYVQSERYPDSKIMVIEEKDKDGNRLFHDNFVAIKYEQDTRELLTDVAVQVYGECRVIYSAYGYDGYLPDSFDNATTFADYIAARKSNICVTILLPPEHGTLDKEREINEIYEKCCENKIICAVEVYYTNDSEVYQSISTTAEMMLLEGWFDADGVLVMDAEFGVQSLGWR